VVSGKNNVSLPEFLELMPGVSNRLSNLILRARDEVHFELPSVLEYWEHKDSAHCRMRFVEGFGKKARDELNMHIQKYLLA
jgi:hypothetical protein